MSRLLNSSVIPAKITGVKSITEVLDKEDEKDKIAKPFQSEAQRRKFYVMADRGEISQKEVKEWESHTKDKDLPERKNDMSKSNDAVNILKAISSRAEDLAVATRNRVEEVEKSLKASVVAPIARRLRLHEHAANVAEAQPALGTNRTQSMHEPPYIPVRAVPTPEYYRSTDVLKSCGSCGYMHKSSLDSCPRCDQTKVTPSRDLRFRG